MTVQTRTAARLPFAVSSLCFGTSPLGSMPDTYGYEVGEEQARATVRAVLAAPQSFIDTSRNYGMGRSEERVGGVIAELGGLPAGCVLATKIDRDMETNRLDADRARRSVEESLEALGLDVSTSCICTIPNTAATCGRSRCRAAHWTSCAR